MNTVKLQTIVILAFCIAAFGADSKVSKINAKKSRGPEPVPGVIYLKAEQLNNEDTLADSNEPVEDYFTEQFSSTEDAFDLAYHSATFIPTKDGTSYTVEVQPIQKLPNDPEKGAKLEMGDDTSRRIELLYWSTVPIYGIEFKSFYVNSNGCITFTEEGRDESESLEDYFETLRVSGLFRNLNPVVGGQVSLEHRPDRVVITWLNVPELDTENSNTFQIVLFYDGIIQISWEQVDATQGIVGLSDGLGVPPDFQETDFSELTIQPIEPVTDDYLTEQFDSNDENFDLSYTSVTFLPTPDANYYTGSLEEISQLPTDPLGGTILKLRDDNYVLLRLGDQEQVRIFNQSFSSFFVGSNGYITFTEPDTTFIETLADHFDTLRISALFTDLTFAYTGLATAEQLSDRVAISWLEVPEFHDTALNTFQIELFYDGGIRISWLDIGSKANIVGLSNGLGLPPDFEETDFSDEYAPIP
jgi:hypothetical protein